MSFRLKGAPQFGSTTAQRIAKRSKSTTVRSCTRVLCAVVAASSLGCASVDDVRFNDTGIDQYKELRADDMPDQASTARAPQGSLSAAVPPSSGSQQPGVYTLTNGDGTIGMTVTVYPAPGIRAPGAATTCQTRRRVYVYRVNGPTLGIFYEDCWGLTSAYTAGSYVSEEGEGYFGTIYDFRCSLELSMPRALIVDPVFDIVLEDGWLLSCSTGQVEAFSVQRFQPL